MDIQSEPDGHELQWKEKECDCGSAIRGERLAEIAGDGYHADACPLVSGLYKNVIQRTRRGNITPPVQCVTFCTGCKSFTTQLTLYLFADANNGLVQILREVSREPGWTCTRCFCEHQTHVAIRLACDS